MPRPDVGRAENVAATKVVMAAGRRKRMADVLAHEKENSGEATFRKGHPFRKANSAHWESKTGCGH